LKAFDIPMKIFAMQARVRAANDALRSPRDSTSPFFASEMGACGRKISYAMAGYPQENIQGRTVRVFNMGDSIEATVIQELRHAHFVVQNCETGCDNKCNHAQLRIRVKHPFVYGRVDGLITGTIDGRPVKRLLELKSMNARGFSELRVKGVRLTQPMYFAQIQGYMFGLKLTEATVIVDCKDNSDLYEETIAYDELFVADLFIRLQTVRRYADAGKLAPPEYPKSSFQCRYCSYKNDCPGLPEPEKKRVAVGARITVKV